MFQMGQRNFCKRLKGLYAYIDEQTLLIEKLRFSKMQQLLEQEQLSKNVLYLKRTVSCNTEII